MKMEKFKPTWYWTGDIEEDARLINMPHIEKEGMQEDRIEATIQIMNKICYLNMFTLRDMLNIQNTLLKVNNWKGIKPGFRDHDINMTAVNHRWVSALIRPLFPVFEMDKEHLLSWYETTMVVHPLSDLNGRVFGIIT